MSGEEKLMNAAEDKPAHKKERNNSNRPEITYLSVDATCAIDTVTLTLVSSATSDTVLAKQSARAARMYSYVSSMVNHDRRRPITMFNI